MKTYLLLGSGSNHTKCVRFEGSDEVGPGSPESDFSGGRLVTLDIDPRLNPDVCHDLDVLPYPFGDDIFDEVHAYEVLEHTGRQGDGKFFFDQFSEFWRILKPGGYMILSVPLWDTEMAWGVPDHKRVFTPNLFGFLEPEYYDNLGKPGYADYRHWLGETHFKCISYKEDKMSLFVILRAVKDGD